MDRKTDKSKRGARQRLFVRLRKSKPVVVVEWLPEELYDRLDEITPENLHPETDWGNPVGKEWGSIDSDIS